MKVRVSFTLEADNEFRRALNFRFGRPGLATREDLQRWWESNVEAADADVLQEYIAHTKRNHDYRSSDS